MDVCRNQMNGQVQHFALIVQLARKYKMTNDKKIEIIRQLLMIDTDEWLEKIKTVVVDGICAESQQDTEDQKEFAEWKAKKKKEEEEEIPF